MACSIISILNVPSINIKSISIKKNVSVCLCLNAFAQFSRYRAETLQVGRGRPGTGRGRVKNCGSAAGGGGGGWAVVMARATPGNPASTIIIIRCADPYKHRLKYFSFRGGDGW